MNSSRAGGGGGRRDTPGHFLTYEEIFLSRLKYQAIGKGADRLKDYTEESQLQRSVAFHQNFVAMFRGVYRACVISLFVHNPQIFI